MQMEDEDPEASTLRLLLSTDNHLGYAEKDPVRGDDSFRTFQEILRLAQSESVDLLLLAGDLFHDAKPSRKTMYQTMSLLRTYCMGDGAVRFQIVSDQSINFPNFGVVNYEDPNYNVQLPVFSIHGNHDDPSREGGGAQQSLAALDLLSAANFVNYFGKSDKVDAIEVFPILLVKGTTRVAIYGLGNMRDERLNRMFAQQKVVFRRPAEHPEQWFSIFVVHQNRDDRGRGAKNCIPESFIPDFIDFVVWGHEHECLIDVQESVKGDFYISQPGSSVATSLVEGEARAKQVAVLEVRDQNFRLAKRALTTVRPFKMGEVVLSELEELDPNDPDVADHIHELLEARVHALLRDAQAESDAKQRGAAAVAAPSSPELQQVLVRLRVEHTGFPVLHNQRFGSRFVGKVANPNDILLFYRRKKDRALALDKAGKLRAGGGADAFSAPIRPTRLDTVTIEDILARKLGLPDQQLVFLPEKPLALALEKYVMKNMPTALDEFVDAQLEQTQRELASGAAATSSRDVAIAVERKRAQVDAEHLLREEEGDGDGDGDLGLLSANLGATTSSTANGLSQSLRATRGAKDDTSSRFGVPRRASLATAAAAARSQVSVIDSMMGSDDSDALSDGGAAAVRKSPSPPKRKVTPRAAPTRSHAAASTRKTPPARAATRKKAPARDWFSDDDDGGDDGIAERNDGDDDDDYELQDDDASESERMQQRAPKRAPKKAPAAARAPKKRLRQQRSDDDDDDNDDDGFGLLADSPVAQRKRAVKPKQVRASAATAKPSAIKGARGEIDLCSSDEAPARAAKKCKPQSTISEMFQRQRVAGGGGDDDVESDAEFTQLARPSELSHSQAPASQAPTATRRKLPLSMVAASQASSQGGAAFKRDSDASAARKGWGRSRR